MGKATFYDALFNIFYNEEILNILENIRNGENKNNVDEYRNWLNSCDCLKAGEEEKAKEKLSWFTPSGILNKSISGGSLSEYSGLITLEILDIDIEKDKDIIQRIESIPTTYCWFQNMDESRIYILVKVDPKHYDSASLFVQVENFYSNVLGKQFDLKSIGITEPVYFSYSPDLYLNPNCEQFNFVIDCETLEVLFSDEIIDQASNVVQDQYVTTTTTTLDIEALAISKYLITGEKLLLEKSPDIPYLLEPIFPQAGIISIVGGSDTGKSSFLRQFATAIVHGDPDFLGFKLNPRYNRAIYMSSEDDKTMMSHLLAKQNPENISPEKFRFLAFIFDTSDPVKKIEQILKKYSVDCIIIDAFSDIFEGDINQSTNIRKFLNKFSILVERHKLLIIFLHHTGKRTEDLRASKSNVLGSQGFEAKMRLVIELKLDPNDSTVRQMWIVKGNYLSSEFKKSSFALKFDENTLRFTNLNKRESNIATCKKESKNRTEEILLREKILSLSYQGLSSRKIASKLKAEGILIEKSKISNIIREANTALGGIGYGYVNPEEMILGYDPEASIESPDDNSDSDYDLDEQDKDPNPVS